MQISYFNSSCLIEEYKNGYILLSLHTPIRYRKKGHASILLKAAQKFVRKKDKSLYLFAEEFSDKPMSRKQLMQMYAAKGFKNIHSNWFQYSPRG